MKLTNSDRKMLVKHVTNQINATYHDADKKLRKQYDDSKPTPPAAVLKKAAQVQKLYKELAEAGWAYANGGNVIEHETARNRRWIAYNTESNNMQWRLNRIVPELELALLTASAGDEIKTILAGIESKIAEAVKPTPTPSK